MTIEKIKAPYVVVKTAEFGSWHDRRQLSTTIIRVFNDGQWDEFNRYTCALIKDAEITIDNDKVIIEGKEEITSEGYGKHYYGKKLHLYDEYDGLGNKRTVEDIQQIVAKKSKGIINLEKSQIKLTYFDFKEFFKRKKTYYIDATPEAISVFLDEDVSKIKKDKKGFYVDDWRKRTRFEPYKIETNNYRLEYCGKK